LSPTVFGVSLIDPSFETHIALTITSLTSHIAGLDMAPSATDRTTRNWAEGETPSLPSLPGAPAGPGAPDGPAAPTAPGSPLSPLSPFGPEQPARAMHKAKHAATG
jgi:hypothetical protein